MLEVKRRLELFCRFTGQGGLTTPRPGLTVPCSSTHRGGLTAYASDAQVFEGKVLFSRPAYSPPSRRHQGPFNWYQSLVLRFELNRSEFFDVDYL
jgi:hypothetical protein